MLTALSVIFTAHLLLSAYAYQQLKTQLKNEQRARIKLAIRIKSMEASWQSSELNERVNRISSQLNSLALKR